MNGIMLPILGKLPTRIVMKPSMIPAGKDLADTVRAGYFEQPHRRKKTCACQANDWTGAFLCQN